MAVATSSSTTTMTATAASPPVVVGMYSVGRYALSIILTYLTECDGGVSLLITNKRFTRYILPLFRLRLSKGEQELLVVVNNNNNNKQKKQKNRHQFVEYPAQDPELLLQRLNTRRLRKRLIRRGRVVNDNNDNDDSCPYEWNKTTHQLAVSEQQQRQQLSEQQNCQQRPAEEELLRFLMASDKTASSSSATTLLVPPSVLVSYPRSGNTLLRHLLERLTGIVTGSDNRPDRKLSRDLAIHHNLVGEGIVTPHRVSIIKTHYPERPGSRFGAGRAILLVRNPYDAIDSYWNLNLTNTHTETVTNEIYEQFRDTFEELALNEMSVWLRFHRYWLNQNNKNIPVLVVRFEDLIGNHNSTMEHELMRIATFLQLPSSSDTSRIVHACGRDRGGNTQVGSYKQPKATTTTTGCKKPYGKSLEKGRYSDDMIRKFHELANEEYVCATTNSLSDDQSAAGCCSLLEYFGYDILKQDFPHNFLSGSVPPVGGLKNAAELLSNKGSVATDDDDGVAESSSTAMEINGGYQLRDATDPYGRSMRQWRLDRTNNDQEPFPIVQR